MKKNRIEGGVILFEFRGGPRDGDCVRSDVETPSDSTNEATTLWAQTRGGKTDKTVRVTVGGTLGDLIGNSLEAGSGSSATERHSYRVAERTDLETVIKVVLEFVS